MLLKQPKLMALHIEMIDQSQSPTSKFEIDPPDAVTFVKVHHAKCQQELLQHLTDSELSYILGQKDLLSIIMNLPYKDEDHPS